MTVDSIDIEATIKKVRQLLAEEAQLSVALRAALEVLLKLVQLLANRLNLNSRNSSKPPSSDRLKKNKNEKDLLSRPELSSICRKNNVSASEALTLLFDGKLPKLSLLPLSYCLNHLYTLYWA